MSNNLKNMNFSSYSFYIRLIFDLVLFENLNGEFITLRNEGWDDPASMIAPTCSLM